MDATERRPFGALLRANRVAAGLSQEELAERYAHGEISRDEYRERLDDLE